MKTDDDAVILVVVRTEKRFVEVGVVFRGQVLLSLKDSDESRKLANTLAMRLADALDIDMKEYTYRIMNSQVFWDWDDIATRAK